MPPLPSSEPPARSAARARAARETMEALAASTDVFATFFELARVGLALADLSGRYVRVNGTYADLVGRRPEDLIGTELASVLHADLPAGGSADPQPEVQAGPDRPGELPQAVQSEERYLHANGQVRWVLHGVSVVPGPDGRPAWFAVSAQDITERRRAEQDLRELAAVLAEQAVRDPLTGLANRTLLEERLRSALARDQRTGEGTGLLFLDLDRFKTVNDEHGHDAGDAVLRAVARRLTDRVRPSDTVARLGGDEFVVLVERAEQTDLTPLTRRLCRALAVPVRLPTGKSVRVGVSVGTAWARGGAVDSRALLHDADVRMYRHKRREPRHG